MERVTGFEPRGQLYDWPVRHCSGQISQMPETTLARRAQPLPKAGGRNAARSVGAETLTACGSGGNAVVMKANDVVAGRVTGRADGRAGDGAIHAR
jgi:hypothetical protein